MRKTPIGIGTNRYANSVNYRGTFSGVTLGAQIAEADGSKVQSTGEDRPWSVAASWTGGPFTVGVGHENPANADAQWTTVNAAWNFNVVKLIGLYGFGDTGTQAGLTTSGGNDERTAYIIGLTAPLGNGELKAAMQYFVQAFSCRQPYPDKYDLLMDIATEEFSHLEIVGATIQMLLAGVNGKLKDEADEAPRDPPGPDRTPGPGRTSARAGR